MLQARNRWLRSSSFQKVDWNSNLLRATVAYEPPDLGTCTRKSHDSLPCLGAITFEFEESPSANSCGAMLLGAYVSFFGAKIPTYSTSRASWNALSEPFTNVQEFRPDNTVRINKGTNNPTATRIPSLLLRAASSLLFVLLLGSTLMAILRRREELVPGVGVSEKDYVLSSNALPWYVLVY